MAITLTPEDGTGIAGANSYISVADADAYFEAALYPGDWATLPDERKKAALITATRTLEGAMIWKGRHTTDDQGLQWPRQGIPRPDRGPGALWPSDEVPQAVKDATCEMAKLLLTSDRSAPAETEGLKKVGLGNGAVELEFDSTKAKPKAVTDEIAEMLAPFGSRKGGMMIRTTR